ncbi:MAG: LamG-like jellyroll fold domain-containing protein [Phycisphaeraceae bacterium]
MTANLFRFTALLVLIGLLASPLHAGSVRYPAIGNIDLREGTIELWLTPTVELYPDLEEGQYQGLMSLFSLSVPDGFSMGASWYAKQGSRDLRSQLHVSMGHAEQKNALIPVPGGGVADKRWQRGEMHHVALTWRGTEMALYADGEQVGGRSQALGFSGRLAGCELIFGNARNRDAGLILHAVRVSRTAHDAETLKHAEPAARPDTLLLDRFDDESLGEDGTTRAEVIAGLTGETGGTLHGGYHGTRSPEPGLVLNRNETDDQTEND